MSFSILDNICKQNVTLMINFRFFHLLGPKSFAHDPKQPLLGTAKTSPTLNSKPSPPLVDSPLVVGFAGFGDGVALLDLLVPAVELLVPMPGSGSGVEVA
jgi:hypothetical protein